MTRVRTRDFSVVCEFNFNGLPFLLRSKKKKNTVLYCLTSLKQQAHSQTLNNVWYLEHYELAREYQLLNWFNILRVAYAYYINPNSYYVVNKIANQVTICSFYQQSLTHKIEQHYVESLHYFKHIYNLKKLSIVSFCYRRFGIWMSFVLISGVSLSFWPAMCLYWIVYIWLWHTLC
jgi:hypothetical protein